MRHCSLKVVMAAVAAFAAVNAFADDVWNGYTQLDWIESNGRNYIDTGVKARSGLVVSGDLRLLSADPGLAIFGASDDGANALGLTTRETINSNWNQFRIHTESSIVNFTFTYSSSVGPQKKYTYKFDNGYFTYGSTHPAGNSETASPYEASSDIFIAWMGGSGENGGSAAYAPAPMLIYSFAIQDKSTGAYLRKMYPARRNSDGAVGMLDTENGAFYLHGGSSPFVAGAEKSCITVGPFTTAGKSATITVSGYAGTTTLSKVPVLVRISTSAISGFSYSDTLANGSDVFFSLDQFGVQRLACDIETWNTSGTSLAWVKIPELKGKATKFYMFWGSGAAAARPPSREVWSSYVGVWHMNSYNSETGVTDETGHGWNATNITGGTATAYNGKFGAALKLSTRMRVANYDTYVTGSTVTNLMPDVITASTLFLRPDGLSGSTTGWDNLFDKYLSADGGACRYGWLMQFANNIQKMNFNFGSGCPNNTSAYAQAGSFTTAKTTWAHAFMRSDGYNHYINIYTTASKSNTKNSGANRIYTLAKTRQPLYFGHGNKSTCMDEVRVIRECLSDDRIKADYDMVNSASFAVASAAHAPYEAAVEVAGSPQEFGSGTISYGFDYDCSPAQAKTYTAPASAEVSGPGHRAVCDGWVLYSLQPDGTMAVERTSENPHAGENDTTCVVTCAGYKKIEWLWHEEYLLTLSSADSTMGAVPASTWYGTNTVQTVTPVPEEGYFFYCWTGDTDGMDVFSTTIPMDKPRALTATFRPDAQRVCEFSCPTNTSAAVDFMDPQYWADGRIPDALASQVTILMPPEGVTNKIDVMSPFRIASLDVGAGEGGGHVEMNFRTKGVSSVSGDARIRSGCFITHQLGGADNIKTTVNYKVNLAVGGDMTIDLGGGIDVTGKGHIVANGPEGKAGTGSDSSGSSHGGADFQFGKQYAYDSALEPCMYGSALYNSGTLKGGGVVRLDVVGALVVNGTIAANGTSNASGYGGAAGGAIWITSGTISGAGSITANGGSTVGDSSGCAGCGGRIAIYQNDPAGTDFSAFTGLVAAYGGSCQDKTNYNRQRQPSSAGTVYYQAYGETVTTATLVIDNKHVMEHSRKNHYYAITPLDARFGTGKIGNLVVRNGAQPAISNNTVEVYGNITIENQARLQLYRGLLKLCGEGEQTITGTNIFYNVSCTVPGKTLKFGTGANDNFRVASGSTLTLKGDESANLVLKPSVAGEPWKITLGATAEFDVSHVAVDHSDASGGIGIEAQSSVDGGDNVNWSFPLDSEPGDPLTWNGSVSGVFAVPGNWTDKHSRPRLPLETDVIIIPANCPNYPTVIVDTLFNSVRVDEGATLTLSSGATLTVTNSFTLAGTLTATGTEKVVFTGPTLDFTGGTVNAGRSIFTIAGEGAQTLNFGGCSFNYLNVRKPGGSAAFLGGFSADTIDILATNSVNLAFAQGVTLAAANVVCRSRFPAGLNGAFVLAGAAQGGTWYVNASRSQYFSGVKVRDCTASGLPARAGGASEDLGNNVNWTFNAATAEWIGGTGDFDTAENWYPAAVPGAGTDVLVAGFDGASAATASGAVSVRTLVVGGGRSASSLRVNGVLAVAGDVEVNTNGTLVLNSSETPNSLGRDFVVRRGGKATHTALPSSVDTLAQGAASNRFYVEVARDVEVEAGGAVNANSCGYATGKGPASSGKTFTYDSNDDGTEDASWANSGDTACAGHGSARGSGASALYKKGLCYGSMFEPTTHGSGGRSYAGGGAIKMVVGRNMHVAGSVTADGGGGTGASSTSGSGTGAGGSVWLDVDGTFSGNGSITARGGGAWDYAGGGGRVALYLRNNEFTGSISAESRIVSHSILPGGGTVLVKGKDSEYYDLKVDCDSWNRTTWNTSYNYFVQDYKTGIMATDLLTPQDAARKSLLAKVRVTVGHMSVLNLTDDLKVHDLNMLVNTGCLVRLNYCTLKVMSSAHKDGKGWIGATIERSTRNRGEIIWGAGFSVTVR